MAKWLNTLDVSDLLDVEDESVIYATAKTLRERINKLLQNLKFPSDTSDETKIIYKEELDAIADELDLCESINDFNYCLQKLYDLGDQSFGTGYPPTNFMWVNTFKN